MNRYLLFFLTSFLAFSCNSQDCTEINGFSNYNEAINTVRSSQFKISDKCDTGKSSWIYGAEYYSCDEETGYFLFMTKTTTYIHTNMPIEVWKAFKKADSFGGFYNSYIKGNYQL